VAKALEKARLGLFWRYLTDEGMPFARMGVEAILVSLVSGGEEFG